MINSDWLYTWIFFWFCFISHLQFGSVNGHNYSCSTLCGTDGVCVARRYCRADVNEYLETCEGEGRVCCPFQPCCRSTQRPEVTTTATTKAPLCPDRPWEKPPNDNDIPLLYEDPRPSNDRNSPKLNDRNSPKLNNRNSTNVGSVNGHNYSCSTLCGTVGLCIARRFCRADVNQYLETCEGEGRVCCPLQPCCRSAQRPEVTTTKALIRRDRPRKKPPNDDDIPLLFGDPRPSKDRNSTKLYNRNSTNVALFTSTRFNGHNYSCSTLCGEVGLCIARRFCRTDVREYLETCEGGSRVCCPLQPCCRSPQRPEVSTTASTSKAPLRPDRPKEKLPKDGNRPRLPYDDRRPSKDRNSTKLYNRNSTNAALFNSTCGKKLNDLFIAGGEISEEHEWPWMAAIFRRRRGSKFKSFQCGGSLINTRYVLTIAQCFVIKNDTNPASYFVRLGSPELSSGEEFAVSNIVVHHNFIFLENLNDIALVRLSSDVYVSDKITPICLPFHDMMRENFVGRMAVVAGWGGTFHGSKASSVLKHVTVPVVSNEDCAAAYRSYEWLPLDLESKSFLCAGLWEGGKGTCGGDSGGPLMLKSQDDRWAVVGLVSAGVGCGLPERPGLYTRVTPYMSWIHENMDP